MRRGEEFSVHSKRGELLKYPNMCVKFCWEYSLK